MSNYELHLIGGGEYRELALRHHGILGQKWGVRRYQNPDGSYTAAGRKRYGIKEYKPGSKRQRFGLDDDIYIRSGTKAQAYRVSRNETDNSDTRYVTFEKSDNAFYAKDWTELISNGDDAYQQTYDIKKVIKAPSLKKRVEICNELYTDKNLEECAKAFTLDVYLAPYKENAYGQLLGEDIGITSINDLKDIRDGKRKGVIKSKTFNIENEYGKPLKYEDIASGMKKREKEVLEGYKTVEDPIERANIISMCLHNSPSLLAQYGKKILERGYNATIDDHGTDATEYHRLAKSPMILFDANNTLVQKGSKIITDAEKKAAKKEAKKGVIDINETSDNAVNILGGLLSTAGYMAGIATGSLGVTLAGTAGGAAVGAAIGNAVGGRTGKSLIPSIADYRYDKKIGYRNKADAQIVAAYKREHPGTKLSKDEILRNYFGGK